MKIDFNYREVWEAISAIDQIDEFWNIEVQGSRIWPVIRDALVGQWFFYAYHIPSSGANHRRSFFNKRLKSLWVEAVSNFHVSILRRKSRSGSNTDSKILCVAYDHIRRDLSEDGKLMDPYIDYLLPVIAEKEPVIFNNWTSENIKGNFFWPFNVGDQWDLLRRVGRKLFPQRFTALRKEVSLSVEKIEKLIQAHNIVELIPAEVLRRIYPIEPMITSYLLDKIFIRKILRRQGVKVLIITGHSKFAWMEAARELGVPSITLQQGLMSDISPWNNINSSASKFKKFIPVPTVITVNGPYFVDMFAGNGFWDKDEIIPIGFARFSKALMKHPPVSPESKFKESEIRILVTSDHHIASVMANYIRQINGGLGDEASKLKWIVKKHPWKDKIEAYNGLDCDVTVVDEVNDRTSLYELLNNTDLHLTSWSATALEAIPYGVPTLFMDANGPLLMSELIKRGIAVDVCKYEHMVALVTDILSKDRTYMIKWAHSIMEQTGYFWADHPDVRFKELIEGYL
jgi:hypothetical protein